MLAGVTVTHHPFLDTWVKLELYPSETKLLIDHIICPFQKEWVRVPSEFQRPLCGILIDELLLCERAGILDLH